MLDQKLSNFTEDKLEALILKYEGAEYCYPPSSIRKMWRNWLRNDKEKRDFSIVFEEKYQSKYRKAKRTEKSFVPYQVGYIRIDKIEPSYTVHLIGEPEYKVFWDKTIVKDIDDAIETSLRKFCKTQSVRLLKSGTRNTLVIETVFNG